MMGNSANRNRTSVRQEKVGVFFGHRRSGSRELLDALGALFSVEFVILDDLDAVHCDAALLFGVSREQAIRLCSQGTRCLALTTGDPVNVSSLSGKVHFSSSSYLHPAFRGRVLPEKAIERLYRLEQASGDQVLAKMDEHILWSRMWEGSSAIDLVAVEPPVLAEEDYLFRYFQTDNWMRLLPILHFFRELDTWELPPLRACFMFDDPNLHWKSYGYVKYQQLVQHSRTHNYHASFATVPMDSWYVHSETASLFRENKSRLSLLTHGNDHTYFELTRVRSDASRQALAAQALRRIERLERLSGLEVSRVMAAPHGACNHEMANFLLRTGFEAACISRSSLMARNPGVVWPITLGLTPAEFLGGGLPTIPRFNIRWDQTYVLFAAFLGQPIIPVGHHDDFAGGMDSLARVADLINSVDEVRWMDMKSIAQTNFCTRREGDVLHVKMYSRKIRLEVPKGIKNICIQRPWLDGNGEEDLAVQKIGSKLETVTSYQDEPISVTPRDEMIIGSICPGMIDFDKVPLPRSSMWAIARRQLSEARDRLRPTMDRLFASKNGKLQRSTS